LLLLLRRLPRLLPRAQARRRARRGPRFHALVEQDALQVVKLVQKHAGGEAGQGDLKSGAVQALGPDLGAGGAGDVAVNARKRQAAFLADQQTAARGDEARVDEDDLLLLLGRVARRVEDHEPHVDADLGRGQADARVARPALVIVHDGQHGLR